MVEGMFNYAILDPDTKRVKFGLAVNPEKRLRELQTGSASRLQLIGFWEGDRESEQRIHRLFDEYRHVGEWFRLSKPIIGFIREHAQIDLSSEGSEEEPEWIKWADQKPQSPNVCEVKISHIEYLQQFATLSTNKEVGARYNLPAQGYWPHYARRVAGNRGIKVTHVEREIGRKATGEPAMSIYTAYPEFVWLAGWLLYAQAKLRFAYEEAWTLLRRQTELVVTGSSSLPEPQWQELDVRAILRQELLDAQAQVKAKDVKIAELVEEVSSLRRLLQVQQSQYLALDKAVKKHFQAGISDPILPSRIEQSVAYLREVRSNAARLTSLLNSIQGLAGKANAEREAVLGVDSLLSK